MRVRLQTLSLMKAFGVFVFVSGMLLTLQILHAPKASAAYNGGLLIDNASFLDANAMNASQIQNFLIGKGAGLANMNFVLNCYGQDSKERQWYTAVGAACDTSMPASSIIYYAAQIYGVSPKVILATMQKEQSLVTAPNPTSWQINQAMGYACPTSGQCGGNSTFPYQIDSGTWVLRYHYERARGNFSWWSPSSSWTCGTAKPSYYTPNLYPGQNVTFHDPYTGGTPYATIYIHNAATSSFYCYTPHAYNNPQGLYGLPVHGTVGSYFTGSYNFVKFYELWFEPGTTITNNVTMNIVSPPYATPARGQTISYTVSFRNNAATSIVVDAIGVVGRAGSLNGTNRDFGWQGPITLAPGVTQQYTFTGLVYDTGALYVWPAVYYQGVFVQYNNWGATLVGHAPNLTLSQPLATSPASAYAGQDVTFSAKLKNNEPYAISYDALGIPVKFYDHYSYDAVWIGPGVIGAGSEITLSGVRNLDKPGPYSYWVSNYFSGTYSTVGLVKKLNPIKAAPNFSVSALSFTDTTPATGENLGASFTVTNTLPVSITVDAVGVVGRFGTFNGPNRDLGWQGPVTFAAGETKSFSGFSRTITDLGTHYYWIGILHEGTYLQYNAWGSTIVSQAPNFSVSALSFTDTTPATGENLGASFTVTNTLPVSITVDAVGVVGRFGTFNGPNRDLGWQGPVTFAAGETKSFSGFSRTITDLGTHYYWIGVFDNGGYLQYNNWGSTIVSH